MREVYGEHSSTTHGSDGNSAQQVSKAGCVTYQTPFRNSPLVIYSARAFSVISLPPVITEIVPHLPLGRKLFFCGCTPPGRNQKKRGIFYFYNITPRRHLPGGEEQEKKHKHHTHETRTRSTSSSSGKERK